MLRYPEQLVFPATGTKPLNHQFGFKILQMTCQVSPNGKNLFGKNRKFIRKEIKNWFLLEPIRIFFPSIDDPKKINFQLVTVWNSHFVSDAVAKDFFDYLR